MHSKLVLASAIIHEVGIAKSFESPWKQVTHRSAGVTDIKWSMQVMIT